MKEAYVQTLFGQRVRHTQPKETFTFELKLCKMGRFDFKSVADHQVEALLNSLDGLYYKIPDMAAINGFTGVKPFDCAWLVAKEAYVVPCFYTPRKQKKCFLIPVKQFVNIRDSHPRKSIRESELDAFGIQTLYL